MEPQDELFIIALKLKLGSSGAYCHKSSDALGFGAKAPFAQLVMQTGLWLASDIGTGYDIHSLGLLHCAGRAVAHCLQHRLSSSVSTSVKWPHEYTVICPWHCEQLYGLS